ncbi:MAG: hypothetical protein IJA08_04895, partial [Clostridia bacterium]|nr:hypothetical protein [Clostridia bacterium]
YELSNGNNMATKNRIVHRLWIIQITTIPRDKISKQNCLRFLYQERVGISPTIAETLEIRRFLNLKMLSDCKMTATI